MFKFAVFAALLALLPCDGSARSVKLGDPSASGSTNPTMVRPSNEQITCTENSDCKFSEECVGLRCVKICNPNPCIDGKFCIPTGPEEPHTYKCVDCLYHEDCPEGMECVKGFKCAKKDPCREAVCSPGAPFCVPVPYQSLPYTCVQCTDDTHCPPVGGLSRKCVNHFCLFNIAGNIPSPEPVSPEPDVQEQPAPVQEEIQPSPADEYGEYGEYYY